MRWQTTAVLGALLAALAGFYYVYEVRLGPERQQAASAKGRVFTGEPADATELAIRRPDQTVRLTKEGDAWQMVEPLKVRGSGSTVQETLTSVLTARVDREIASAPEAVAEFGLDKPAAVIAVAMKDGTRRELELGSRNPTGVWVYAREAGKPAVFLVGESVLRDATRPVADFRDRTVLSFERGAVSGVDIVTRDAAITVEPAEGRWRITRPVTLPADRQLIDGFLDKLRNGRTHFLRAADALDNEGPIRRWITEVAAEETLIAPLHGKDALIGALYVDNRRGGARFSSDDRTLLEGLANQSAIALENARLVEDLRRSREQVRRADRLGSLGTLAAGGMGDRKLKFEPLSGNDFVHVAPPYCYRCPFGLTYPSCELACVKNIETTIQGEGPDSVAEVLVEPIMSGVGVAVPPDEYLPSVAALAKKYGALLHVDEVINGFGRTGKMFAHQHYGVRPDILAVAKGISSAYLPIAATAVADDVYRSFYGDPAANRHVVQVNTYGGHPAAAAVALRNVEIMLTERLAERAAETGRYLLGALGTLTRHPWVGDVRGKNVIILDDEIATGGSILELLGKLREMDVQRVALACTHGLFTGKAIERLDACGLDEIVTTNTVPVPAEKRLPNMTVLSIAPLLAEAIHRIHEGESVSALFKGDPGRAMSE